MGYPPLSRFIRFVIKSRRDMPIDETMAVLRGIKYDGVEILGPSPAPVERLRGFTRWHVLLKGTSRKHLHDVAHNILKGLKAIKGIQVEVDVDPIAVL